MPELLELVTELASVFDRLQMRFALGGALATSYWGIVRTTQDVDCLVAVPASISSLRTSFRLLVANSAMKRAISSTFLPVACATRRMSEN